MNILEFKKNITKDKKKLIKYYKNLEIFIKSKEHLNFYKNLRFKEIIQILEKKWNYAEFETLKKQPLFAIPFFLKENFWIKSSVDSNDINKIECGSKILKNFIHYKDSFFVSSLKEKGAFCLGLTRMDELALGGTGLEGDKPTINPIDPTRITGGSSSGSAVASYLTKENFCLFSVGSDTGDSVRAPSVFLGIVGFKPSYGLISRRGLVPYAPSLDTVGILCDSVSKIEFLSKYIFKYDKRDLTSQFLDIKEMELNLNKKKPIKIGYFIGKKELKLSSNRTRKHFKDLIKNISNFKKIELVEIKLEDKLINSLLITYRIISYIEAISSQANLTGIIFGELAKNKSKLEKTFEEQIIENRTQSFLWEVKKRYITGSFFSKINIENENLYRRGQKIRCYIKNIFDDLFEKYEFIISPTTFDLATKIIDEKKINKNPKFNINDGIINDIMLITNFLGGPSIVLPYFEIDNLKLSLNIFSKQKNDYRLIKIAKYFEKIIEEKK